MLSSIIKERTKLNWNEPRLFSMKEEEGKLSQFKVKFLYSLFFLFRCRCLLPGSRLISFSHTKLHSQLLFCCVLFHWTSLGGRSLLTISTRTGGRGEEKADMKRLWKWQHYRWSWRQESNSHRSNEICVLLPRKFHLFHFESHFPSFFMGACARETLWKCC